MAYIHLDAIAHPHPHPYLPLSTRTILGYIHLDSAGKPCGRGWISAGYNCSPDKRAYTKQYRQADRDKAAQAIREERRAAKGYKKEVKSIDDFVKNVNVLQDEISSKLANLEYDYDQPDPQPKDKKQQPETPKNLDLSEGEKAQINGIENQVIGGELAPIEGDDAESWLMSQESEVKAKKQQQQAQKQAEKRRKAAERQAKAADKKISQLDKQMQRGQSGRKKLSTNDKLKLAENKFKAQSDRQAALENIIQATLAAQQSQQVDGKSGIVPFSSQSIRDRGMLKQSRRMLEQSLRDELNKLSDLSSEADAANQIFEMNRKLKEESAGMKDVINRSNELVRKSRIEKLKRMWNMDSLIEAAAANKTAFEQRFPTRQISIPANTSLVGYLNALSGMARGDSATIKEYSVIGSSYHADSASDVALVDGCYLIKNAQDKFIRI